MCERPYVVVVGGANMDICGRPSGALVARDSNLGTVRLSPGGVGRNIAHNLALLGVDVRLVTCFGKDSQADVLVKSCTSAGIDVSHAFSVAGGATSTYLYVTDRTGEMQVAINDMAILDQLTPARLAERQELLDGAAAVVVETNIPTESLRWATEHVAAPLFCDPISTVKAHKLTGLLEAFHALKPNLLEAEALTGVRITDEGEARQAAKALLGTGLEQVFLSMGTDGLLCADQVRMQHLPLVPCQVANTTGAGDAMAAGLVWAHLQGLDLVASGRAGMAAAGLAVESDLTVNPHMSEELLVERMGRRG